LTITILTPRRAKPPFGRAPAFASLGRKRRARPTSPSSTPPPARDAKPEGRRLLKKKQVLKKVGVSYPTIWKWMRDGTFPRSREMGGLAVWFEDEIDEWLASLPPSQLKGDE
jgi:prophage regulatory protein